MNDNENWRTKVLILGIVVGAAVGVMTAYLFNRAIEERGGEPPEISTGDLIKTGIAVFGMMRGIAALGDGK